MWGSPLRRVCNLIVTSLASSVSRYWSSDSSIIRADPLDPMVDRALVDTVGSSVPPRAGAGTARKELKSCGCRPPQTPGSIQLSRVNSKPMTSVKSCPGNIYRKASISDRSRSEVLFTLPMRPSSFLTLVSSAATYLGQISEQPHAQSDRSFTPQDISTHDKFRCRRARDRQHTSILVVNAHSATSTVSICQHSLKVYPYHACGRYSVCICPSSAASRHLQTRLQMLDARNNDGLTPNCTLVST